MKRLPVRLLGARSAETLQVWLQRGASSGRRFAETSTARYLTERAAVAAVRRLLRVTATETT
jgi:hypothetical protein